MRCEDVLRELSARPADALTGLTGRRVKRHLDGCPECAAEWSEMERLIHEARSWRADAPPQDLQARIFAAAREEAMGKGGATERRQSWTNRMIGLWKQPMEDRTMQRKLSFAVIAIAAGTAFVLNLNGKPTAADAQVIKHMEAAAAAVRNAHVVTWMSDYKTDNDTVTHHGSLDKVEELWYENGRTRKEGVWGSRLIVGATDAATDAQGRRYLRTPGAYYRYDPKAGKVTAIQESGLQWSHFTLDEVAGDLLSRPPSALETVGVTTLDGQKVREISVALTRDTAAMNHNPEAGDARSLCWISVESGLPVLITAERYEAGAWSTKAKFEFSFNQDLAPALFDPATLAK